MSEIPEDIREKAKRFAQIADTFTHRADFEAIIAEVCAKVIAAERKDATERAAKWHEFQAETLQQYEDAVIKAGGWPDTNGRVRKIAFHREAASATRGEGREG